MSGQKVINIVGKRRHLVRNTGGVGRPGVTFSNVTKVGFVRKGGRDEPFEYLRKTIQGRGKGKSKDSEMGASLLFQSVRSSLKVVQSSEARRIVKR